MTMEEGLEQLKTLCFTEIRTPNGGCCVRIPKPSAAVQTLLQTLDLDLPDALPRNPVRVVTRKKLPTQRKKR